MIYICTAEVWAVIYTVSYPDQRVYQIYMYMFHPLPFCPFFLSGHSSSLPYASGKYWRKSKEATECLNRTAVPTPYSTLCWVRGIRTRRNGQHLSTLKTHLKITTSLLLKVPTGKQQTLRVFPTNSYYIECSETYLLTCIHIIVLFIPYHCIWQWLFVMF